MDSKVASFDESKENLKNNISDEQPLKITDALHEDDLVFLCEICTQLFYSNADIYSL